MGWTDEEIDEIAREASHNTTPQYKQEYWKEMEALLDSEKTNRKGIFWWFFGSLLLVFAIGSVYYFNSPTEVTPQATVDPQLMSGEFEFTTKTSKENTVETTEKEVEIPAESVQKLTNQIAINQETHQITADQYRKIQTVNNQSTAITEIERDQKELVFESVGEGVEEQVVTSNLNKIDQNQGVQNTILSSQFTLSEESIDPQNENPDLEAKNLPIEEEKNPDLEDNNSMSPVNESPTEQNLTLAYDILKRKYGFYVVVNAGAGTSYMMHSKDLLVQWGVKLGYDYTFFDRLRLGVGVGFRQQLVKDLVLERNRTYYSLGLVNVNQSIQYDRLYFVDLNIHAHYLFRKFAIGLQFTPSYLIGARAHFVQTEQEMGKFASEELTTEKTLFVQTNSLNSFGFDAGISLQYEFKYKMSLELNVNSRLNKLIMNKEFIGNGSTFPVRLELGIIKRF